MLQKLHILRAPENGGAGAGAGEPEPIQTQAQPKAPDNKVTNYEELKAQIKQNLVNDFNEEKAKELQKIKDAEIQKLIKEKADLDKKVKELERAAEINKYESNFRELAGKEGATKTDQLLRLADREKSPEEAIKELKEQLPELFIKAPSINDIGGGTKGANVNTQNPEDIGKMSMEDYKKWRLQK